MLLFTSLSMVSACSPSPKIGDEYGGGIVFYIDSSGRHGLVAAKTDMSGQSEGHFSWYDAKALCNNLLRNGYGDWFLPNKEQLNKLYLNKSAVGGFEEDNNPVYWSSTEESEDIVWVQFFDGGSQGKINKTFFFQVRAVRAF